MSLRAKKELNNELNLTPFIDLLSTLVCFLLVSAVWVQVSTLELKQSQGTDAAPTTKESAELDVELAGPAAANIVLKKGGKTLSSTKIKEADMKAMVEKMNMTVIAYKQLPALKGAEIQSVLVAPHEQVNHGDMVAVLDGLRIHGISNIGVKPDAAKR